MGVKEKLVEIIKFYADFLSQDTIDAIVDSIIAEGVTVQECKVVEIDQVREKLVELANDARMNAHWHGAKDPIKYMVDVLIANGVRLEEKQATSDETSKPSTDRAL